MAEEVGFEPTVDFHLRRFSRPVHSTTLPLLRQGGGIGFLRSYQGGETKNLPIFKLDSDNNFAIIV